MVTSSRANARVAFLVWLKTQEILLWKAQSFREWYQKRKVSETRLSLIKLHLGRLNLRSLLAGSNVVRMPKKMKNSRFASLNI